MSMISGTKPNELAGQRVPNEIWICILEAATRPTSIIGDETCPPDEIETFIRMWETRETAIAVRRLIQTSKSRLRAVCRIWRELTDALKDVEWVVTVCITPNSKRQLEDKVDGDPEKSRLIPRLDILFYGSGPVEIRHSHPVSSLTLEISTDNSSNELVRLDRLSSVIAHPTNLRSIHLMICDPCPPPKSLLVPLTQPNIRLLTLSITTSVLSLFNSNLTFPYLTTFSLRILFNCSSTGGLETTWVLPSLINLSLHCSSKWLGRSITPFLSCLLASHSGNLRSLRVFNVLRCRLDMSSPSFWARLPRLEVFATAFNSFLYDRRDCPLNEESMREALLRAWPTTPSLRHFIQNGAALPSVFVPALVEAINCCPTLDTVSLCPRRGSLFGSYTSLPDEETGALRKLEEICSSRGIRILNAEGSEMKDVLKSYS